MSYYVHNLTRKFWQQSAEQDMVCVRRVYEPDTSLPHKRPREEAKHPNSILFNQPQNPE